MSYILRVRLSDSAELEIPFDTLETLKGRLQSFDLSQLSALLQSLVGQTLSGDERAPRPELEGIASRGPMGMPRFSKIPSSKAGYVALTLFAVEPRHLESKEIESVTGIQRVASHYLSGPTYKRFFMKDPEDKFSLSTEGKRWVTEEIIPSLKPT